MTPKSLPAALCLASLLALGACSDAREAPQDKAGSGTGSGVSTADAGAADTSGPIANDTTAPGESGAPATGATTDQATGPHSGPETKADAATGIRSVYSSIKGSACKTIAADDEAEYREQKCTGFAGVPLYIKEGDLRADLDAGAMGEFLTPGPFNAASDTVEWRVGQDGQPFAIIFRLTSDVPDQPKQSWLMVETVGKGGKPGCRLAEIPGATRDANQVARDMADAAADGKAQCMTY